MTTVKFLTQKMIRAGFAEARGQSYLLENGTARGSVPGFGVRYGIRKRSAVYVLRFRDKPHRLAPWSDSTPPQKIRPAAERLRFELSSSAAVREALGGTQTIAAVGKLHLARLQVKPKTMEEYELLWRKHINPTFGKRRIEDLTPLDVERWLGKRRHTPAVANRALQQLHASLVYARRQGWIQRVPTEGVATLRERKKRRRLTEQELNRLMQALALAEQERLLSAGSLAVTWAVLLTGCRPYEVRDAPLRYAHLNARVPRIEWPPGEAKGDRPGSERGRVVFLPDLCVKKLKSVERRPGETWLIPGARKGEHLKRMKSVLDKLRELTGIEDLTFRALRTTWRSEAKRARVKGADAQLLMGHAPGSPMTDGTYLIERREELLEQAAAVADHLLKVN